MKGCDPETPAEWQEAVNAASFCLALDSAVQYGLVQIKGPRGRPRTKHSGMHADRAVKLLEKGKALGIFPDSLEKLLR